MKKKKYIAIILVLSFMLAMSAGYIAMADAGSTGDPLVSLSYLTNVFKPAVMTEVDSKISTAVKNQGGNSGSSSFTAIAVSKGQYIIGGSGCEMILRSGEAASICPGSNGLADVTGGIDLPGNQSIVKNHVYVIARNDGRGIAMLTDGYVMVKGSYSIK